MVLSKEDKVAFVCTAEGAFLAAILVRAADVNNYHSAAMFAGVIVCSLIVITAGLYIPWSIAIIRRVAQVHK